MQRKKDERKKINGLKIDIRQSDKKIKEKKKGEQKIWQNKIFDNGKILFYLKLKQKYKKILLYEKLLSIGKRFLETILMPFE